MIANFLSINMPAVYFVIFHIVSNEITCEIGKKLEGADLMNFSMMKKKFYELMEKDGDNERIKMLKSCKDRHNIIYWERGRNGTVNQDTEKDSAPTTSPTSYLLRISSGSTVTLVTFRQQNFDSKNRNSKIDC